MAHLWTVYLLNMVIFHGYVKWPDGNLQDTICHRTIDFSRQHFAKPFSARTSSWFIVTSADDANRLRPWRHLFPNSRAEVQNTIKPKEDDFWLIHVNSATSPHQQSFLVASWCWFKNCRAANQSTFTTVNTGSTTNFGNRGFSQIAATYYWTCTLPML